MRPSICGILEYVGYRNGQEIGWVHSDVCPKDHSVESLDEDYRKLMHQCLDEWFDKSQGTGHFYVGDAKTIYQDFEDDELDE